MKNRSLSSVILASLSLMLLPISSRAEFRQEETFHELIGMEVRNLQNEKLGRIQAIIADVANGRIVEVVVNAGGGFAGMGGKLLALPPRALAPDFTDKVLRVDVSKSRFEAGPRFDSSHMKEATQRAKIADVIRYYGLAPWFALDGQKVEKNGAILQLGHLERTSQILDLPVHSSKGDYLGMVNTLFMDVPKGFLYHVIVADPSRSLPHRVLQARSLRYNTAKTGLIWDASYVDVADKPLFQWNGDDRRTFKQEAFVNRDLGVAAGKPLRQGSDARDRDKTARIRAAIQADPTLSAAAGNVEIATWHSLTTLRGNVNTSAIREKIGEIAQNAGRAENVSNLIQVGGASR